MALRWLGRGVRAYALLLTRDVSEREYSLGGSTADSLPHRSLSMDRSAELIRPGDQAKERRRRRLELGGDAVQVEAPAAAPAYAPPLSLGHRPHQAQAEAPAYEAPAVEGDAAGAGRRRRRQQLQQPPDAPPPPEEQQFAPPAMGEDSEVGAATEPVEADARQPDERLSPLRLGEGGLPL